MMLVRHLQLFREEDLRFQQYLLGQSSSLNQICFQTARLFAARAETGPPAMEARLARAASLVSQVSALGRFQAPPAHGVPGGAWNPLGERLPGLERRFLERKAALEKAFDRLADAREQGAQEILLAEFEILSLRLLEDANELNITRQELQDAYFAHLRTSHLRSVDFLRALGVVQMALAALIAFLAPLGVHFLLLRLKSLSGLIPHLRQLQEDSHRCRGLEPDRNLHQGALGGPLHPRVVSRVRPNPVRRHRRLRREAAGGLKLSFGFQFSLIPEAQPVPRGAGRKCFVRNELVYCQVLAWILQNPGWC